MVKKGKLDNGFEYSIDTDVLDDMELVDAISAAQGKDPTQISVVVDKVLGDSKTKLYDLVRTDKGNVPTQAVSDAVIEIINKAGTEGKN